MIFLRLETEADTPLRLAWRNNPLIYQGFYTQSRNNTIIGWDENKAWLASRNKDWRNFIIMLDESTKEIIYKARPIGIAQIGQLDHWSPEIGYLIDVGEWRKGYGKEAVRQLLGWIKTYGREYCHTTVLKTNVASIKLLESLGFAYMAEARPEEIWMTKKL